MKPPAPPTVLCQATHFPEGACAVYTQDPGSSPLLITRDADSRLQADIHEAEPGSLSVCPSVDEDCAVPEIHFFGLSALGREHMGHLISSSIHPLGSQTGWKPRLPLTYPRQVLKFSELRFMHLQNLGCQFCYIRDQLKPKQLGMSMRCFLYWLI